MKQYLIERHLPGAGNLSPEQLREVSEKSDGVLRELGPDIRWQHSYVLDDCIYCLYEARDAGLVQEHARRGGFPCDRVMEVKAVLRPHAASV